MISPTVPTSTENLVPGTIHWSSKVQVRGTEEEAIRLGSRPGARSRNRERRPIYILDKLVDGRFLVLTCTTRHNTGIEGVPEEHQLSFLPIEPSTSHCKRPTIRLVDDPDAAFEGKTLIFTQVAVLAYDKFFMGYAGSVLREDQDLIYSEFYSWQLKRVMDPKIEIACRLTSITSFLHVSHARVSEFKPDIARAIKEARVALKDDGIMRKNIHLVHFMATIKTYLGLLDPSFKGKEVNGNDRLKEIVNHENRTVGGPNGKELSSCYGRQNRDSAVSAYLPRTMSGDPEHHNHKSRRRGGPDHNNRNPRLAVSDSYSQEGSEDIEDQPPLGCKGIFSQQDNKNRYQRSQFNVRHLVLQEKADGYQGGGSHPDTSHKSELYSGDNHHHPQKSRYRYHQSSKNAIETADRPCKRKRSHSPTNY